MVQEKMLHSGNAGGTQQRKNCSLSKIPILKTVIVQDDMTFRQLLKTLLMRHFYFMNIEEVTSNKHALKKIKQFPPQLIFMDINMADGSNLPLVKKIKKAHPDTIIVALTLYNIQEYKEAAFQSGADYSLAKNSLTSSTIIGLVESIIGRLSCRSTRDGYRLPRSTTPTDREYE